MPTCRRVLSPWIVIFLLGVLPGESVGWEGDAVPHFAAPPRLATTAAEWQAAQKEADFPARKAAALAQGEALLKNPPVIPSGAGDWTFYYACLEHGADLQPKNLDEHVCPVCKKVYTDERTKAAYRTRLHDQANLAAEALGWAYLYSHDDRFAVAVRDILLKYAEGYKTYPPRHDRWGRTGIFAQLGGRRYAQSLDEAVAVIHLCRAYDLTRTAAVWSEVQRQHVERDLFRTVAETLLFANLGINNHQTWFNAGLMCIASVLGDKDLVHKVLTMRGGFHDQLQRSMGENGFWYEGAMAYHNYALQAMKEIVDAGRRMNIPLHQEPRIKAMILAPLQYAYPNGQFPAINDSDISSIDSFNQHFLWAWKLYRDPRFAHAYARGDQQKTVQLLGIGAAAVPTVDMQSINLPDAGLMMLRRGSGESARCAMVDYGEHGGGHGHYDKLNLLLYTTGREWLLDPGRLSYSHKEYKTWVKHTAAHNTVALGGRSQAATTGESLWLQVRPRYSACAVRSTGAYPGSTLVRYLLLTDDLLVDVFQITAAKTTQIDWFAHAISARVQPVGKFPAGTPQSPGQDDGYQHLTSGKSWKVSGPSQWEFVGGDHQTLRLWLGGVSDETLFSCEGIGYYVNTLVPCLLRRVSGSRAAFVTVYDLSGKANAVTGLTVGKEDGSQLVVQTPAGPWKIEFSAKGVQCVSPTGK